MASSTKRNKAIREQLEPGKLYLVDEALELLKKLSGVKFKESVDVAIRLVLILKNQTRMYVARLYCPTVPGNRYGLQSSHRVTMLKKHWKLALTLLVWMTCMTRLKVEISHLTW